MSCLCLCETDDDGDVDAAEAAVFIVADDEAAGVDDAVNDVVDDDKEADGDIRIIAINSTSPHDRQRLAFFDLTVSRGPESIPSLPNWLQAAKKRSNDQNVQAVRPT